MTIIGFSLADIDKFCGDDWFTRLGTLVLIYIALMFLVLLVKIWRVYNGISLKIRGITVNVQQGDIFKVNGWKVIPFNEYFDTVVDDVIIAKNTLNGILIENHIDDLEALNSAISSDNRSPLKGKYIQKKGKYRFPLGCIKIYNDFMLLAFTHFNDQNEARLTQSEYEDCLRFMWKEINRTYANKPIYLPLLGSGITRFDGTPHKSKSDLLNCMLCTLRKGQENINMPISIILTKDALKEINLYEMKGD